MSGPLPRVFRGPPSRRNPPPMYDDDRRVARIWPALAVGPMAAQPEKSQIRVPPACDVRRPPTGLNPGPRGPRGLLRRIGTSELRRMVSQSQSARAATMCRRCFRQGCVPCAERRGEGVKGGCRQVRAGRPSSVCRIGVPFMRSRSWPAERTSRPVAGGFADRALVHWHPDRLVPTFTFAVSSPNWRRRRLVVVGSRHLARGGRSATSEGAIAEGAPTRVSSNQSCRPAGRARHALSARSGSQLADQRAHCSSSRNRPVRQSIIVSR